MLFSYLPMPIAPIFMPKAMVKESMFGVDAGTMPMPMSAPRLPLVPKGFAPCHRPLLPSGNFLVRETLGTVLR